VILRYIVPSAALTAVLVSLAVAPASAAPLRATGCSGVLQCATITLPPASKSPEVGLDRPWYRPGIQPSGRVDQYPRGTWYKPYPVAPTNATPRW
jgi:hypothetical protein